MKGREGSVIGEGEGIGGGGGGGGEGSWLRD
jgi:hypothetical protein